VTQWCRRLGIAAETPAGRSLFPAQYARSMDDEELRRRGWRGMVAFQRLIGRHAPGAAPLERDAFVASAVPKIPSSLINAACPRNDAPLTPHLDEIAGFYEHTPKWGAWIDPANDADAKALKDRGLVLDSRPLLMATPIDAVAAPNGRPVERATMAEVGDVNDRAYGSPAGVIASALGELPAAEIRGYGIRVDGELSSVASIIDVDQDAFVTMVATLPHRRGNHLASSLLAHALHDAKTRNKTTTSLQASKLGQSIYARLGYRALGEVHLYEKRPQ
jgi:ribosomal protein S18 acetylase RimI-like enzyme